MFAERAAALALALLLVAPVAVAEELLSIDEETPAEETATEWGGGRWSAALAGRGDGEGVEQPRVRALWEMAGWRGLASYRPGSVSPWRGGLSGGGRGWSFAAGGLEGEWGEGLLLGSRRRGGLGRVAAPERGARPLAPGAGGGGLGSGAAAEWRTEDGECGLALLELRDGGECLLLSLGGRGAVLRALLGDGSRGLAVSARVSGERQALRLSIAWAAADGEAPRPAIRWRLAHREERIEAAIAGLAVAGPPLGGRPVPGWVGAEPGRELHAALAGEEMGVGWRIAFREREGLGLAEGETRREAGLDLRAPAPGGRATLRLRRIATRGERPLLAAPGFPRSEAEEEIRQELSAGWNGTWRWRWTWRGGSDGAGSRQLHLAAPLRGALCSLQLFSVARGTEPLILYDRRALARRVESLSGSGWRLTLSGAISAGPGSVKLGCSYTGRAVAADDAALWAEFRVSAGER